VTIIIGVLCSDGAVIGADTQATVANAGGNVGKEPTKKLRVLTDRDAIYTHTGEAGAGQRIGEMLKTTLDAKPASPAKLRDEIQNQLPGIYQQIMDGAARNVASAPEGVQTHLLMSLRRQLSPSNGGFVATYIGEEIALVAFENLEEIWLVDQKNPSAVMGSGSSVGAPFMSFVRRVLWKGEVPTVQDAVLGVAWALSHAIDHAPTGVGGDAEIAVCQRLEGELRVEQLGEEDLAGVRQLIGDIETAITDVGRRPVNEQDEVPTD